MMQQQFDQVFAGVTGRTDDGDFFRFHVKKSLNNKGTKEQSFFRPWLLCFLVMIKAKNPPAGPAG